MICPHSLYQGIIPRNIPQSLPLSPSPELSIRVDPKGSTLEFFFRDLPKRSSSEFVSKVCPKNCSWRIQPCDFLGPTTQYGARVLDMRLPFNIYE